MENFIFCAVLAELICVEFGRSQFPNISIFNWYKDLLYAIE